MEDGSWDQVGEGGGEEWHGEDVNEEVVNDEKWNEENLREDVPLEQRSTYETTVVEEEKARWTGSPQEEREAFYPPNSNMGQDNSVSQYDNTVDNPTTNYSPDRPGIYYNTTTGAAGRKLTEFGQHIVSNVGFGQTLKRFQREAWGAARPGGRSNLRLPCGKVRFTQTGSKTCNTSEECIEECQALQKYYMDLGFTDIPYNFMIGGDGAVYHGRGWLKQAARSPAFYRLQKSCIDVAYIGEFTEKKIPYEMLAAAADLLKFGIKSGRLSPFIQSFTFLGDSKRS